jgi:hypothetical protein
MIVFSHIRNTPNMGDFASCPAQWFDFPNHRVQNYDEPIPDASAIIYGGGTMNNWLHGRQHPKAKLIAWGIGSSRHRETDPWPDPDFELVGVREWSEEREVAGRWAPCASCMSLLFNGTWPIKHEAVLFVNASPSIKSRYPVAVGGLPVMENDRPMAEIVSFLASAEVVVTNSYHGVVWATLLRRRVVCLPYSSKFYNFRHPPAYSRDRALDWREAANEALVYPAALAECRAASQAFYERVMGVLGERQAA